MKRFLLMLLCWMLPIAALADAVAMEDIPLYNIEPSNGLLYTDGVLPAGTPYSLRGHTFPEAGTALADYFVTSGPIEWGQIAWDHGRIALIVLNPDVILGVRAYSEVEAAEAERRFAAYGDAYAFEPFERAYAGEAALVLCERLTLRAEPRVSAAADVSLAYGAQLTCTGNWQPGWLEVVADGQTGWVREAFLLLDPQYITFQAETPVLAWPAVDAPWVGLLEAGASAPILGERDGYTVISLRGASGFVSGR